MSRGTVYLLFTVHRLILELSTFNHLDILKYVSIFKYNNYQC